VGYAVDQILAIGSPITDAEDGHCDVIIHAFYVVRPGENLLVTKMVMGLR
jgi:hypothetical protein